MIPFPINLTLKLRAAATAIHIAIPSGPRPSIALKHSQDGGAESTVSQLAPSTLPSGEERHPEASRPQLLVVEARTDVLKQVQPRATH